MELWPMSGLSIQVFLTAQVNIFRNVGDCEMTLKMGSFAFFFFNFKFN